VHDKLFQGQTFMGLGLIHKIEKLAGRASPPARVNRRSWKAGAATKPFHPALAGAAVIWHWE
jgi:hypothetical protein